MQLCAVPFAKLACLETPQLSLQGKIKQENNIFVFTDVLGKVNCTKTVPVIKGRYWDKRACDSQAQSRDT